MLVIFSFSQVLNLFFHRVKVALFLQSVIWIHLPPLDTTGIFHCFLTLLWPSMIKAATVTDTVNYQNELCNVTFIFSSDCSLCFFFSLLPSFPPLLCCRAVSCTGWPVRCMWPADPRCQLWEKAPPRGTTCLWPESCAAQRWGGPTMHLCTHLQGCRRSFTTGGKG